MRPPKSVLTPATPDQPSRLADVIGVGQLNTCPNCKRTGRLTVLLLAPGDVYPNQVVLCGDNACGAYWTLGPAPPQSRFFDEGGDDGVNP